MSVFQSMSTDVLQLFESFKFSFNSPLHLSRHKFCMCLISLLLLIFFWILLNRNYLIFTLFLATFKTWVEFWILSCIWQSYRACFNFFLVHVLIFCIQKIMSISSKENLFFPSQFECFLFHFLNWLGYSFWYMFNKTIVFSRFICGDLELQ